MRYRGKKVANGRFKMVYKYIGRVFDLYKLHAENISLRLDIAQLNRNHEKEIKMLEAEIKKLQATHETQLKRNEVLRADNVGMYRMVKRYQKKLGLNEKVERRKF